MRLDGVIALFWSGEIPSTRQAALVATAQAWIGHPLTPLSYAGVARRTTRRAVAAGAYATGVAVGATVAAAPYVAYPAPGCVQVVNSYGQITYQCP